MKPMNLKLISAALTLCLPFGLLQAQALQDPQQVADIAEQFLLEQASVYPGVASVHITMPTIRNQPQCTELQPTLSSGARLRSRQTVTVRCLAPTPWSLHVQAQITIEGFYYTSNKTLQVGDIIHLDDLVAREGDILRLAPNTVIDPSLIIGYIASQRINAGNVIRSSALRDPQSIQRGQTVRTIARGTGFVATGEGQALQNGSPGTQIQVRVSSGEVITGTVLDAQTVQVLM